MWQLADSDPLLAALVDQPGVPAATVWSIWQRRAGCEQVGPAAAVAGDDVVDQVLRRGVTGLPVVEHRARCGVGEDPPPGSGCGDPPSHPS